MKQTSATDTFVLSNGVKVPCIGYGTFQTPKGEKTRDCVKEALLAGYRHIDTAFAYGNEESVGEGIRASGVKREEIFLTTKHWVTERGLDKTLAAVDTSLKNLGVDYLDLYLIHWPCVEKVSPYWKEINAGTWRGMERALKAGKIRAIGVSNFEEKHLKAIDEFCEIRPMVNQLQFHPGYVQWDNVRYCQEQGMLVQAWSPLGSGAVLKDERLAEMARKYGVSVAQLCVRFALQCGVNPLPKSTDPARMRANMDVFGFEIAAEDIQTLIGFPELGFSTWKPEEGPAETYYD